MKRFALNKVKIAKLVELQKINGRGINLPDTTSINLQAECTSSFVLSCATNTSIDGQGVTNP